MEWAGTILSLAQMTDKSPEEGIDSRLTRCVFKPVVWERSGWFPVFDDALDVCVTAGRGSWETGRKREGTARSMAETGMRSYEVEQPGRPQEAEAEDAE